MMGAFPLVRICKTALYGVKSLWPYIFRSSSIASCWYFFLRFSLLRSFCVINSPPCFCKRVYYPYRIVPASFGVLGQIQHSGVWPGVCPRSGIMFFNIRTKIGGNLTFFLKIFYSSHSAEKMGSVLCSVFQKNLLVIRSKNTIS